jgi:hypothetical protein
MRKDRNELSIVRRFPGEVAVVVVAGEEGSLDERACPQANCCRSKNGVGDFQRDAADIFVCEEIPGGELEVVDRAEYIEEEGIAAPTGKKRWSPACFRCPSWPRETGTPEARTVPPEPASAAFASSNRRSVAVCSPPTNGEKRTS